MAKTIFKIIGVVFLTLFLFNLVFGQNETNVTLNETGNVTEEKKPVKVITDEKLIDEGELDPALIKKSQPTPKPQPKPQPKEEEKSILQKIVGDELFPVYLIILIFLFLVLIVLIVMSRKFKGREKINYNPNLSRDYEIIVKRLEDEL